MNPNLYFAHEGYSIINFDSKLYEYRVELKERREERGFSVAQLAERCNVSDQAIYNIENCINDPSLSLLIKLCAVLKCSLYELVDIHDLFKGLDEHRIVHIII